MLRKIVAVEQGRASARPAKSKAYDVKEIATEANGDIRTAINMLQFMCIGERVARQGQGKRPSSRAEQRTDRRKPTGHRSTAGTAGSDSALSRVSSKDVKLDMFRALGKVLYNKRLDETATGIQNSSQNSGLRPEFHRSIPKNDPEELILRYGIDGGNLTGSRVPSALRSHAQIRRGLCVSSPQVLFSSESSMCPWGLCRSASAELSRVLQSLRGPNRRGRWPQCEWPATLFSLPFVAFPPCKLPFCVRSRCLSQLLVAIAGC